MSHWSPIVLVYRPETTVLLSTGTGTSERRDKEKVQTVFNDPSHC